MAWSGKSPYFTLPFSFLINISVKIIAGLLRNLCGNLDEKFRDVPGMHMDEMEYRQKFRLSRAAGHFPATAARVSQP